MGKWAILLAGMLLTTLFGGCFSQDSEAQTSASRPDDAGAGRRPTEQPGRGDEARPGGFSKTSVFPGTYRAVAKYSFTLQNGTYGIADPQIENLRIGQGGAIVQIAYVLPKPPADAKPKAPEEFPVIVLPSIYYNALKKETLRTSYNSNPDKGIDFLIDNFVPHGYAVAFVPIRGTAGNGGCYEWWGDAERNDLKAALDWIEQQAWSRSSIGLIGLSMAGAASWMGAGLGHAAIKTIVPVSSETDLYSWFVRNGTPSVLAAPIGTTAFYGLYSLSPFNTGGGQSRDPSQIPSSLNCPTIADAVAANAYMTSTGARDPRRYAEQRDLRPDVEANYTGSIFLIHGFHDWLAPPHLVYPWVNQLEDQGITVKHMLGQWRHRMPDDNSGAPYFQPTRRVDFAEILLHWFDYWLKDDKKVDLGPRAQVADSQNRWRDEATWPPQDAATLALYAAAEKKLGTTRGAEAIYNLAPDPRRSVMRTSELERLPCETCAIFQTPPMQQELQFAGLPHMKASVVPLGPGGVLTAYLYAVTGDQRQLLGWATMDLRYASGGVAPATVTPGTAMSVRLEFEPLDAVVPTGSSLQLEISQGGYGEDMTYLVPKNEALAPAAYYRGSTPNNPIRLEVGGDKTVLELPQIVRTEFFAPPVPAAAS